MYRLLVSCKPNSEEQIFPPGWYKWTRNSLWYWSDGEGNWYGEEHLESFQVSFLWGLF